MRYLHSMLWLLFGAAWISAFFVLASTAGGAQWLIHMGQGVPAVMNILLASLSLAIAGRVVVGGSAPRFLLLTALAIALLHLFNGLGVYLMITLASNRANAPLPVMWPFLVVGSVLPTNPTFVKGLVGSWQLVAL